MIDAKNNYRRIDNIRCTGSKTAGPLPPELTYAWMKWGKYYHMKAYENTNGVIEAIFEFRSRTRVMLIFRSFLGTSENSQNVPF